MKLKRLLKRVELFLNAKERDRRAERDEIRKILGKLKKKERKLKDEVAQTRDAGERAALQSKLKVLHAQREKGIAALKNTKKAKARRAKTAAASASGG